MGAGSCGAGGGVSPALERVPKKLAQTFDKACSTILVERFLVDRNVPLVSRRPSLSR